MQMPITTGASTHIPFPHISVVLVAVTTLLRCHGLSAALCFDIRPPLPSSSLKRAFALTSCCHKEDPRKRHKSSTMQHLSARKCDVVIQWLCGNATRAGIKMVPNRRLWLCGKVSSFIRAGLLGLPSATPLPLIPSPDTPFHPVGPNRECGRGADHLPLPHHDNRDAGRAFSHQGVFSSEQTCRHTCQHICEHACPHTCQHTCQHTCKRACPRTYQHACRLQLTNTQVFKDTGSDMIVENWQDTETEGGVGRALFFGLSYGLYTRGLYRYVRCSRGLYSYSLYDYGLYVCG